MRPHENEDNFTKKVWSIVEGFLWAMFSLESRSTSSFTILQL